MQWQQQVLVELLYYVSIPLLCIVSRQVLKTRLIRVCIEKVQFNFPFLLTD